MDTNTVSAPEVHASIDHPYSDFMSNIGYPKEDDSRSHENLPDGIYLEDVVDDDNSDGIYRQVYTRSIVENGQKVEKPANRWIIILKDKLPKKNKQEYCLGLVKRVISSGANEAFEGAFCSDAFHAVLTDEELEKICGLEEVAEVEDDNETLVLC